MKYLPRHSTVAAYLALFFALTTGAYAAVKLAPNSVATKHVKNNAITGAKVKDGSLAATDFAAGQIPAAGKGEKGDKGDTGAQGPKGDTGPIGPAGKDGKDATLGVMPYARGVSAYVVNTTTPEQAKVCDYKTGSFPSGTAQETTVAWWGFEESGGFTKTADCTNGYGFVVPRTGTYTVTFSFMWGANATGYRTAGLRLVRPNGADYLGESRARAVDGSETAQNVTATFRAQKDDMIQAYVIQNSGVALGTIYDPRTSLTAQFVAP